MDDTLKWPPGCAARPDLLDRALMRPGRLDRLLYVGVAQDAPSKASVLAALTRKCGPRPSLAATHAQAAMPGSL